MPNSPSAPNNGHGCSCSLTYSDAVGTKDACKSSLCKERIEIEPKTEFERDRGNSSMKSRPILPLISFNPTQRRPEKTKLIKQEREAPRWFVLSKIKDPDGPKVLGVRGLHGEVPAGHRMGLEEEGDGDGEGDGGDAVCIIHLSLDRKIRSAQLRSLSSSS